MSETNDGDDPEKTREARTPPPPPPTRNIPSSPADGPTRFIPVTPPRRPHPPDQRAHPPGIPPPPPRRRPPAPPPRPAPAPRVDRPGTERPGELPWWQTINRDRPPKPPPPPTPPAAPQTPPVKHAPPVAAPPPPPQAASPASRRSKAWWGVTAFAAAAVLIAGAALVLSLTETRTPARVLDIAKTQRQVEQILRDPLEGYGAGTVTAVVCNNGINPTIARGSEFSCKATVDGSQRRIAVVFQDDDGTYAVDRPR